MIEAKTFEIRDAATFIPALAIRISPSDPLPDADVYLMRRSGYGFDGPLIVLTRLSGDGTPAHYDPYAWMDRTWQTAHEYIAEHWDDLASGEVIDVEFILGDRAEPKVSERVECPL